MDSHVCVCLIYIIRRNLQLSTLEMISSVPFFRATFELYLKSLLQHGGHHRDHKT